MTIYTRLGKKFRKLERYETIKKGAMQSRNNNDRELEPIETINIGHIPAMYPYERDFYNPIEED